MIKFKKILQEVSIEAKVRAKYPYIKSIDIKKDGSYLLWTIVSSKKLKNVNGEEIQYTAGYSPQGYNFLEFKEKKVGKDFKYTWKSYSSSD